MTDFEFEKRAIALAVFNCSPIVYGNAEIGKNYTKFTFNEICELIAYYQQLKRKALDTVIIAWTTLKDRGASVAYWCYDDPEPYYNGTGKFHAKAMKTNKYSVGNGLAIEYDDFLYNYISLKFNTDINYIKSYIKLNNFTL